jgi:serine/threonine protein kinase
MSVELQESLDSKSSAAAKRIASELLRQHPADVPFDAKGVLAEHPELSQHRSVIIDLAYEEYCQKIDAGEKVSPGEFIDRFPMIQRSLRRLLEVHKFIHSHAPILNGSESVRWPQIGETVLGFHIVDELGQGAFSRVFLANEPGLGNRAIVLKICQGGRKEADLLGTLQHPNIVPVHSVQADDETGLTAICMPYLGRTTLFDLVDVVFRDGSVPQAGQSLLDAVATINGESVHPASEHRVGSRFFQTSYVDLIAGVGAELADVLAFTHEKGFCHGDVKPSNVLLTSEGRALLFDFNLSYLEQGDTRAFGGTLPYMAPELLQAFGAARHGQVASPDGRSDIYSLGVVLYELLCGVHPFGSIPGDLPSEQIAEYLLKSQEQGPRPISQFNKDVDSRTAQLVESCLSFSPGDRPATARLLADAFRQQLSVKQRFSRRLRVHKRIAIGLAAVALSLIIYLGVAWATDVPPLRQGKMAYVETRYVDAIDCFSLVLADDPSHTDALRYRGRCYIEQEQFDNALDDFTRFKSAGGDTQEVDALVQQCHSEMADLSYDSGQTLFHAKKYKQSEEQFNQALEYSPGNHAARFLRGRSLMLSGFFEPALEDFKSIPTEHADVRITACIGYCRAAIIFQKSQPRVLYISPMEYFKKSFGPGISPAAIENNLAFCHLQRRQIDSAEEHLTNAIGQDPGNLTAHFQMAKMQHLRSAAETGNGREAVLACIRQAMDEIEMAIQLATPDAADDVPLSELHFEAAYIFSSAAKYAGDAKEEAAYAESASQHWGIALKNGLDPARGEKLRSINPELQLDDDPPGNAIPTSRAARSRAPIGLVDPLSNVDDELSPPR